SVLHPKRLREEVREKCGDDAEHIGHTGTERDQSEHIQASVPNRLPTSLQNRKSRPKHHRSRQRKLKPVPEALVHPVFKWVSWQKLRHRQRQERDREYGPDPETTAHADELGARPLLQALDEGFERHATDRAASRL